MAIFNSWDASTQTANIAAQMAGYKSEDDMEKNIERKSEIVADALITNLQTRLDAAEKDAEVMRELLVEARGYLDRLGQEGVRNRIDAAIAAGKEGHAL